MADMQEAKNKKTRTVKPKPVYVVTPAGTEVILVTKDATEVFAALSENPGAIVKVEQVK
jgi:phosphosulfolactate phosphohydrolase-like enzyme